MIYHRISEFCKENLIHVYDINGRELSQIFVNRERDIPYFHLSYEDLQKEIEKHSIISFDIFDTLIMRKILYPKDIFDIVERKLDNEDRISFATLRMRAESELNNEGANPTIYEIYDRLQKICGISDWKKEELLNLEINTEMEFLVPRQRMLELFDSIKMNKKIYLISDMYLTKDILIKVLKKCGYEGYEDIYVSCEKRRSKTEGLFDIFISDLKEVKYSLHIGDNEIS